MMSAAPTKRALRLRLQAARVQERALPDQVRRAYGAFSEHPAGRPAAEADQGAMQESARAALVERGHLTAEELATLTVDEAVSAARARLGEQIAALQEESALLASQDRGQADSFARPPKTLHRR